MTPWALALNNIADLRPEVKNKCNWCGTEIPNTFGRNRKRKWCHPNCCEANQRLQRKLKKHVANT